MSLSRPARFPLLKLPLLCIKCVIHNSEVLDIICLATISKRTRRIVKNSKYPLKEIDVSSNRRREICMELNKYWDFMQFKKRNGVPRGLQRYSEPFLISRRYDFIRGHYLRSKTTDNTLDALKMGIDFVIDLFGCTIRDLSVAGNELSELFGLGIKSVKELHLNDAEPVNKADLKHILENIKVTDRYIFSGRVPEDFYCDPRIFKCRRLQFLWKNSADWVTLEILRQFDVPQLTFWSHRFSKEDIVSYITHWLNSENRKLEYLYVSFRDRIRMENFKIDHLSPMPFCEKRRNRFPFAEDWEKEDMSSGMDILREDGLLATFFVKHTSIFFYIWHKRFLDTV